jgi:pimeloyl-ACP methyl ester carboxylesterase
MLYSSLLGKLFRTIHGPVPAGPEPGTETGLVLLADGVGGLELCGMGLRYAAARAGLNYKIHVAKWGHGFGRWHADLTNVSNHDAQADALVSEINEFKREHPNEPVFLIGKSGGTGVVAKALERLPEDTVERVILLSSALSPEYDLTQALRAVRHEMVVFWSPLDLFVLGLGTQIFGTVDRVNVASAGLVGFRPPATADLRQYEKLRQVKWNSEMIPTGYLGGHVGPDSPAFLQKYVVPLLQMDS